ncbi:hypothetical protein HMSSN036_41170 [Paenibacillus macerans]|nr:hypothetical protein HMSSN036_41170 [Paenibacillus macerans]
MMSSAFPKGFLWGSSTNAQQFEGGWNKGGKGVSIADVREIPGMPEDASFEDFKNAAQHYTHYKEDIAYYGLMGFGIYRFTMAWTRIFPNGNDPEPNEEGLAFYDRVLTELEKYGIQPVVTLYAYDLPLHLLESYDGWMSRQCIQDYLRYVETVINRFKGRVKYWVPFNEQNFLRIDEEYMTGYKAKNEKEIFRMEHHFNLAYAQATALIHRIDPAAKPAAMSAICAFTRQPAIPPMWKRPTGLFTGLGMLLPTCMPGNNTLATILRRWRKSMIYPTSSWTGTWTSLPKRSRISYL